MNKINISSTSDKLLSFFILIISTLFLSMLLTYNTTDYSLNSTSLVPHDFILYKIRNVTADIFFQLFGKTIYIVPIIFLIWSYKLFLNQKIKFVLIKIYILIYLLFSGAALVHFTWGQFSGGLVGLFLSQNFSVFLKYDYLFWSCNAILLLFVVSIKPKEYYLIIKLVALFINFLIKQVLFYSRLWSLQIYHAIYYRYVLSTSKKESKPTSAKAFKSTHLIKKQAVETTSVKTSIKNITPIISSSNYNIPLNFLSQADNKKIISASAKEIQENVIKLEQSIKDFNITIKVVNIKTGPVVTLYEVALPAGVKTSKLIGLETDIALRMKAVSVRIAIVPGKDVVGIEIPNKNRKIVYLREILEHKAFQQTEGKLPMVLGHDINGTATIADLAVMPHLLIAGTTGSGKSVGINAMILSLLYKFSPEELKLIMIDPKMLELSVYQDIPHLLTPVVTNPKQAVSALKWAVREMESRYYKMSLLGVRNIIGYNEKLQDTSHIEKLQRNLATDEGINIEFTKLPYLVVIIDEMADLMLVAGKEVENTVQRLAQMARAAGIHVIMATQRPSADVITGVIKSNFPTRISFQVSSKLDSRIILGEQGAEQLLGKGDMLYMAGVGKLQRIHGPFIADEEVSSIANYLRAYGTPNYVDNVLNINSEDNSSNNEEEKDDLYNDAIAIIQKENKISTSFLQRKFQIGYNRAARLVEQLEENGVISKPTSSGKREILIR